ncbi:hypothetical protein PNA2_1318 [Pyrococcus sp. NA2]|uniref:hypothetical protein n=1 Tax=Pyrococcus sp. (strain NA2) TaxID=342949 RepID=UPI000209AD76|nr:hypothetical protein [Pyrococcus sp. NA2]AEC52233.1 hypothetical protein PNA2_1318 [Pyrococcus sp. NA2]
MNENTVSAKDVFNQIAEQMNITLEEKTKEVEKIEKQEVLQEEIEVKKRKYIGKSARINAELMKEALRELKKAHERSYQPEVTQAIERAVRLLKVIIKENEEMFPRVLRSNTSD